MSAIALSGGRAICDFFRVNAATTGLMTICEGLALTTTADAHADKAFTLSEIVGTSPAFQEDGTVKITFDQYEDTKALNDFLNAVAVPPSSATGALPAYKLETGTERSTASVNNNLVLAVYYGAKTGTGTSEFTKAVWALGTVSPTSGSWSSKADDWNKPTFEFVGSKAGSLLTIATALFDSTVVTVAAPKVIASNVCFGRDFLPNAV